jgi:hypothetical protein
VYHSLFLLHCFSASKFRGMFGSWERFAKDRSVQGGMPITASNGMKASSKYFVRFWRCSDDPNDVFLEGLISNSLAKFWGLTVLNYFQGIYHGSISQILYGGIEMSTDTYLMTTYIQ